MLFHRLRVLIVSAFIVSCCFASLPVYPGRIKNTPHRIFPLQNRPLDIISTGGVAIDSTDHTIKETRIRPQGTTSCSRSETNDDSFIYCQGEEQKTQFTLQAPPRMQKLEIEADAITRIEDGSKICHVSPGENSNPHIHCDAPPKDMFSSGFPYLNGRVRPHYKQFKEQGDTLNSYSNHSEDDEISEDLPVQMRCDNPHPASPTIHRLTVITGVKKPQHKWDICQQSFKYPCNFKRHNRTLMGEKPYVCDWDGCNQRFSRKHHLKTHKSIHTGVKPYTCGWDGCNQRFSRKHHLKAHKSIHTGEKPYACDWNGCEERFSQSNNLDTHKRTHTGVKPYACDWDGCEKYFTTVQNRDVHKRSHTGEKPYDCDWDGCNKCFSQKYDLKRHKLTHTGEKPYACDWDGCNQRFSRKYHLKIHNRVHTGEKPYACDWDGCSQCFSQSGDLKKHKRVHTREKPYVCDWGSCNKRFSQSGNLSTHKSTHTENSLTVHPEEQKPL